MGSIALMLSRVIRFVGPYVVKVLRWTFTMALTTSVTLWVGIPEGVRRITGHWMTDARDRGIPAEYLSFLELLIGTVAILATAFGWIVLAYLTVLVIGIIP